jgi:hypothetical protein
MVPPALLDHILSAIPGATQLRKMQNVKSFQILFFAILVGCPLLLNSRFEKEIDNVYDRGGRMDLGNMLNQESPTFRYIFLVFIKIFS